MTRIAGYKLSARDQVFLGPKMQELMALNLLKQSEVARALHIDASLIYLWSIDRRPVPHNRIEDLAKALEVTTQALLEGARVVPGGAAAPRYLRIADEIPPASVTNPVARKLIEEYNAPPPPPPLVIAPLPAPPSIGPSEVQLLWCDSTHGTGVHRRHHHGVAPSWGPGFMTLEKSPPPYVRSAPAAVSGIVHRAPRLVRHEQGEPKPIIRDVLIDPRQWKADPPPAAPEPKPARVVKPKVERPVTSARCGLCGEQRLTSYAAVTEHVRSAAHVAAVAQSSMRTIGRDEDGMKQHNFHVTLGIACNCTGKRHCGCGALIVWKLTEPVPTVCTFCGSAVAA